MKKSKDEGFTIIEVMIVLAIVGLIMLVVFMAVPALQRNSRNTSRKADIGRVTSAVTSVVSNNNGAVASITSANVQNEVGTTFAYYAANTAVTVSATAAPAAATNTTTIDTVVIYRGAVCAAMTGGRGATSTGASARSVAVTYRLEAGNGTTPSCTEV